MAPFVSGFILCILVFTRIEALKIRTLCPQPHQMFPCDADGCIYKTAWCNGNHDCSDGSDEQYCSYEDGFDWCDEATHFRCATGTCIPISGRCDGFTSCPDMSDEMDCPCEDVHHAERIDFEATIDFYHTHQNCWRLPVNEDQYIKLTVHSANFYERDCKSGNLTISTLPPIDNNDTVICPAEEKKDNILYWRSSRRNDFASYTFYSNVTIRYRSDWYYNSIDRSMRDSFDISYETVDILCQSPGVFRCRKNSCILPEKQCDGVNDCENGVDEMSCDYGLLSADHMQASRRKAIQWLKNQHDRDWGWRENTHRAIVALYLSQGMNFSDNDKEDLIVKQLELQMSTVLLRSGTDKVTSTQLSMFINSLLVTCHNPKNFYGFNLIADLKVELKTLSSYIHPLPYLTLCNAKERISDDEVNKLLEILEMSSNLGFILEIQAVAAMALKCITKEEQFAHLKRNVTEALNVLKKEQMEDGSFGNVYTTALVLQTLIANDQLAAKDWKLKTAVRYLKHKQEENGSFGDFLSTYLILPILNGKSLVDVGSVNCTGSLKVRHGNLVSGIQSKLGNKASIKYSLFIGDEKDQIHPIVLRAPENITVLELMTLAADIDPKYKYKTHKIKQKMYIYEISGIPNDPEDSKFWFMYRDSGNGSMLIPTQSPGEVTVNCKENIIMWYKTLDFL